MRTIRYRTGWAFPAFVAITALAGGRATARAAEPAAAAPRTGEFTAEFTERSPLSAAKSIGQRLGRKDLKPDYDLAKEPFVVYVPDDYKPTVPHGVLVLLNYKDTENAPEPVLPTFKQKHLIFVAPKGSSQPDWVKCGLALDAVHNLKKRYAVDPGRVFMFDFDPADGGAHASGGQHAALAFADVFTGSLHTHGLTPWKPVRAANGATYPVKAAAPPAAQLGQAKAHPIVLRVWEEQNFPSRADADRWVQREGFRHLKMLALTNEQVHYPNYTTDWLGGVIDFFDQSNAANRLATRPAIATRPATAATRPAAPAARPPTPAGRPAVQPGTPAR